jgi:hypothetical protein
MSWKMTRPFPQDQDPDQDFSSQDQDETKTFKFCPRGVLRPRQWSRGLHDWLQITLFMQTIAFCSCLASSDFSIGTCNLELP